MKQTTNINQNIHLHYIPMKKLKTTTIGIFIHRPLNDAHASMNALLPYVLKRGTKQYKSSEELAKSFEELYGASLDVTVIKRGEDQIIYFDSETISDKYTPSKEPLIAKLLSLMLSVIFEPLTENGAFLKETVEQEKKNSKERINSLMNDKRTFAQLRCLEEMCRGEAFAISRLGTVEGIDRIDEKTLYNYYLDIITSSVIDIYISGDADTEEISKVIGGYIEGMEFKEASIPKTEPLKKDSDVNNVTDHMEVTQGKLAIGFRANTSAKDPDFVAMLVMNAVFGGGAASKLFNNVREKLSLAYYAASQFERYKGLLFVNAGVEFKNFKPAFDETMAQLEAIRNGEISDFELNATKSAMINSLKTLYDDQRAMQSYCLGADIEGLNADIEERIALVSAVSKDEIASAAKKLQLDTVYFLTGKEEA